VKHAFASGKSDGADATLVKPSNWNDFHVYDVQGVSTNTTLTSAHDIVEVTTGSSTITITLPTAVGIQGKPYCIKKVDSGTGSALIAGSIDGVTNYSLTQQWQFVEIYSDNANWKIKGKN
jgi:hypothetical protein